MLKSMLHTIPAIHFVQMLSENVNNESLSDDAFRELVRNTLKRVEGGELKDYKKSHVTDTGVTVYKEVNNKTPEVKGK